MRKDFLIFQLLLITSFCFRATPAHSQLKASFSADIVQGCAPVLVKFKDGSTGGPSFWRWDLGNGTVSFLQNPATTYFNPGTYSIKLFVQNSSGADSLIKLGYITIHAAPVISFSASDTTGCYPLHVHFTDLGNPGDGSITSWQWDFGDGSASTSQNPDHTYTGAGNFNISLQAKNSFGCVQTLTRPAYIKLDGGVKADFIPAALNNCKPPTPISFVNSSTGTGSLSYLWDFGDGQTSTAFQPTHTYTTIGNYTVKLRVHNNTGCGDSLAKTNIINIGTVKADFNGPATICAGQSLLLTNTSTPTPGNASWIFGDGSSLPGVNVSKTYSTTGAYTIELISDFGACKDSVFKQVQVLAKPQSDFNASLTRGCHAPLTTNFTQLSTGAVSWIWLFGDGTSSTNANPTHTYLTDGVFDVTLISTNAAGCNDTLVKKAFIQVKAPVVNITQYPQQACVPFAYTPTFSVATPDTIASYFWDFGDGQHSTLAAPVNNYTIPGTYNVKLVYTTNAGCTDSVIALKAVQAGAKPVINFSATPPQACAFKGIQFFDQSSGAKDDQWLWYFGDEAISTGQNPSHIYQDTGYFTVKLVAWSNGCKDSLTIKDLVYIKPPIANFYDSSAGCNNKSTRYFIDRSIGATSWSWDFGDGTTSTQKNNAHTYLAPGSYIVTLTVKNDTCENKFSEQVIIMSEISDFSVSDTVICRGTTVTLTPRNSNPQNVSSYIWNINSNAVTYPSIAGSPTRFLLNDTGQYNIELVVTDKYGCQSSLKKPLYIRVNGPSADFVIANNSACNNSTILFSDSSKSDGTHPIKKWLWNYGDGTTDSLTSGPFQHFYTQSGNFQVSLTVTDNNGCSNTTSRSNAVLISKPVVQFLSPDTLSCSGKVIRFLNQSTGNSNAYQWNFGDGQTSGDNQPVHAYATEGVYSIKLFAQDRYGCKDSVTKPVYVNIRDPKAHFTLSDSIATCPPLVISFNNHSVNYNSFQWDFGDGTFSSVDSAVHFYTYPGTYYAKLTITSAGGCIDTVSKAILVKGPEGSFTYDEVKGCNPTSLHFQGHTKDKASFVWDFNDGNIAETGDSVVSHVYTSMGDYLPRMILVDPNGCRVPIPGEDTIHIYGVKAGFNAGSHLLCDSGFVNFHDSSVANDLITSWHWTFGDGSISNVKDPVHFYANTGNYTAGLTVTTQNGCTDNIHLPVSIKIVSSPMVSIQADNGACVPAVMHFNAQLLRNDTSALKWHWNFGNNITADGLAPPAVTFYTSGQYRTRLICINSSGCADTVYKTVQAFPLPDLHAGPNQVICEGGNISLNGTGCVQYLWSPATNLSCTNCATPSASPQDNTMYYLVGKNIYNCTAVDSVLIKVKHPFTMRVNPGDTLCKGESLQLGASGAEVYLWEPSAGLNDVHIDKPKARPDTSTVYQVIGSDDHGCFADTGYVTVTVYPYPTVNAGDDKTIPAGGSVTLHPVLSGDVKAIKWLPPSWLSCATCAEPVATPKETTTYSIEVINQGGCISKDEVTVFVFCNNSNLFMPNTFSPNGDGNNDVFYPRGQGIFTVKTLRIFNRWGEVVFERANFLPNDAGSGWDGRYKGQLAPQDVYVYSIEVECENKVVMNYKGNIALIR